MIFVYTLNMLYTFKFKSVFGNKKCALRNIKSALFLFSVPCPFLAWGETLMLWFSMRYLTKFSAFILSTCKARLILWICIKCFSAHSFKILLKQINSFTVLVIEINSRTIVYKRFFVCTYTTLLVICLKVSTDAPLMCNHLY